MHYVGILKIKYLEKEVFPKMLIFFNEKYRNIILYLIIHILYIFIGTIHKEFLCVTQYTEKIIFILRKIALRRETLSHLDSIQRATFKSHPSSRSS